MDANEVLAERELRVRSNVHELVLRSVGVLSIVLDTMSSVCPPYHSTQRSTLQRTIACAPRGAPIHLTVRS